MSFLIKFVLILTVFLTPLISPVKNLGYEQSKVVFFIVCISLSGFLWIFIKPNFIWGPISKLTAFFNISLILTSLFGLDTVRSIIGTQPYFQGVILYLYLFLFFIMVKSFKIKVKYWAWVLSGSATIVGILAILDWILLNFFNQQIPTYAGRVVSTFGQPNFYSGFILLTLPFYYLLLKKRFNFWIVLSFLISIIGIILSGSRASFLLLGGLFLFWLIWEISRKRRLLIGGVLVILLIALVISITYSSGLLGQEIVDPKNTNNPNLLEASVEKRFYIWPIMWQLILQKPVTGYGLENISPTFSKYFADNKHSLFEENLKISPVLISLKEVNIDRAHNYVLDLALFSGLIGVLAWLILVVMLFLKLGQAYDRNSFVLITSLIIYLIWIQFQNQSVVHLIYFWLIAGLIDQAETIA